MCRTARPTPFVCADAAPPLIEKRRPPPLMPAVCFGGGGRHVYPFKYAFIISDFFLPLGVRRYMASVPGLSLTPSYLAFYFIGWSDNA